MSATVTPGWTALCQEAGFAKRDNHMAQRSVSSPSRLKTQGCSFGASDMTQDISSATEWGEDPSQTRPGERTPRSPFHLSMELAQGLGQLVSHLPCIAAPGVCESGCGMEKGKWVGEAGPTDLESGGCLS